jgi:SAM-dependent methyltransferase
MKENYYDLIAHRYDDISFKRRNYLLGVEDLVIKKINKLQPEYILDVGSGDGKRLLRILSQAKENDSLVTLKGVVALEPSINMFNEIQKQKSTIDSYNLSVENYKTDQKYDLILCLWNVIGHIESLENFLIKLKSLLTSNGTVIIDFNNKYNINYYGIKNVVLNRLSHLGIGNRNRRLGYFGLNNKSIVKIWSESEFTKVAKRHFKLCEVKYLNYDTGKIEKKSCDGQIFVCIEKL